MVGTPPWSPEKFPNPRSLGAGVLHFPILRRPFEYFSVNILQKWVLM
jgi:hypothetical protein